ncbi:ATP-binding protein [Halovenus rubra]|uniref:ATP-binding protein n=2 Tax=Halovenus rubra TaxID=869890 RepID=A0ACC7E143_9EURY|nr:ATP-binding protein [Halovenus rubra]
MALQLSCQVARERLYEILRRDESFEEKAQAALELGEQYLNVDNGHLTRIDTETDHWEAMVSTDAPDEQFPPGMEHDFARTYCRRTLAADSSIALHDALEQGWEDDPAFEEHGLHCYHGTTLVVDGEPYGTVCFVAEEPREQEFTDRETMFAELLARLFEHEIERERHEAELTRRANLVNVLNRVLRHNVRNDISVVRGRVQLMTDRLEDDSDGTIAMKKIDELIELSQKARDLEQIVDREFERQPVDVTGLVERVVERTATEHSEATFHVEGQENVTIPVFESFERAIEELVENAAKHGGDSPTVTVTVEQVPNAVDVHIADDGPGISEAERRVLRTGEESPLIHGSGIGLWIVHWVISSHSGSVEATATSDGTTLSVSIPRIPEAESGPSVTELKQARDRYQALFEKSSDAMVLINDDAVIVEANTRASDIYGLAPRKLLGRSIPEFLPDDFDFQSAWTEFKQAGSVYDVTTIVGADGVDRRVEYSATTDILPGQHLLIVREVTSNPLTAQ